MNFLVMGKRPVFFALFLIVTMAVYSRWNSSTNNGDTNNIPSPKGPNSLNHKYDAAIPRTSGDQGLAMKIPAAATATAGPGEAIIQVTAQPVTPTAEVMTLALTPTLTVPSQPVSGTAPASASLPSLGEFSRQVKDGQSSLVRGLYASHVMALRVVPQPQGDPGFISAEDGTATLFQTASFYGVTGLLAHNFLSGREFFRLSSGQQLDVIYGDGQVKHYRVSRIDDFQRLSINDLRSNFMELSSGLEKTADQVFADFYEGSPHLTLQTCIERDGEWNWGVRFITADPVN
jgi:hypothetical protein